VSNTDELRAAAQQALVALVHHTEQTRPIQRTADAIEALRAALAQPAAPDRWNEGFKHGQWLAKHSAPVVERADSATPVVERDAGNLSDNAAPVAHAEPASEPAPAPRLRWAEAPRRTEWGAGMMEALIALGVDETLRLYAHRDAVPMVDALLSAQPAPARVPLTTDQLRAEFAQLYPQDDAILHLAENNRDYCLEAIGARHHWRAFERGARAIEAHHGITAQGEPK